MPKLTNEQLQEIQDILTTLIDATDHFTELMKAEEMEQGVYIFTTIVEGMESVFKVLPLIENNVSEEMSTIEASLQTIGRELEMGGQMQTWTAVLDFKAALEVIKQESN